ncbi:MAG TPA: radical SAM protein [Ktedonobacteraceae bacterium]|jgi:uncharacterized protein|nr:radical SAM protein [Ktedonobacteraceae bacterium]
MLKRVHIQTDKLAAAFDPGNLNLILLPTEKCNFRCTYCYEDFKTGRMRPAVIAAVKNFIQRRAPDLHSLEIGWFGGEPLIAKPVIYEISQHILDVIEQSSHSFAYQANITTNGYYLDEPTVQQLVALGINFFQISLDGYQEMHDRTRVKADGSGSFSTIWSNLLAIRESNLSLTIMLRVHFSPENFQELDRLIEAINHEFADDRRFTVYFKSIERLGGPHDSTIRRFSYRLTTEVKRVLESKLKYEMQIYRNPEEQPYICYASKPNSFIFRANGDVAKCTVALSDERNRIGELQQDGTIHIDQPKLRPWIRGFASLNEQELACPYRGMNGTVKGGEDREDVLPG